MSSIVVTFSKKNVLLLRHEIIVLNNNPPPHHHHHHQALYSLSLSPFPHIQFQNPLSLSLSSLSSLRCSNCFKRETDTTTPTTYGTSTDVDGSRENPERENPERERERIETKERRIDRSCRFSNIQRKQHLKRIQEHYVRLKSK